MGRIRDVDVKACSGFLVSCFSLGSRCGIEAVTSQTESWSLSSGGAFRIQVVIKDPKAFPDRLGPENDRVFLDFFISSSSPSQYFWQKSVSQRKPCRSKTGYHHLSRPGPRSWMYISFRHGWSTLSSTLPPASPEEACISPSSSCGVTTSCLTTTNNNINWGRTACRPQSALISASHLLRPPDQQSLGVD